MTTHPAPAPRIATIDRLRVAVHADAGDAGRAGAAVAAAALRRRLARPGEARVVFAAAPSQDAILGALREEPDIDWSRVTAFQMDEYVGLPAGHPQAFGTYLNEHIYAAVRPGRVHELRPDAPGEDEAARYAGLLGAAPIDLVCLGIGENGHLAFNDPGTADFADPQAVKVVELDDVSRVQQVNDGCFASLGDVPVQAVTATIPQLLSAATVVGSVPGPRKRAAVRAALFGAVGTGCPASALRDHPDGWLFLDPGAAPDELLQNVEAG